MTWLIILWNVADELQRPKLRTVYENRPWGVTNDEIVFALSVRAICQKPFVDQGLTQFFHILLYPIVPQLEVRGKSP